MATIQAVTSAARASQGKAIIDVRRRGSTASLDSSNIPPLKQRLISEITSRYNSRFDDYVYYTTHA